MIERIAANPKILGGKPVIKGTRMSVEFILELLASGVSETEILEDYPHLEKEDIRACIKYAAHSCKKQTIPPSKTGHFSSLKNLNVPFFLR